MAIDRSRPPVLLVLLIAVVAAPVAAHETSDPVQTWWDRVSNLCGKAFAGTLEAAPEGDIGFVDKALVMHVRDCTAERIRIPFVVGDDRSRTWVLTRHGARVELKHDHRHADGSADALTMYGGTSVNAGSADTQMFPADDHTRLLLPGSGLRSVWLIEVEPGQQLVYAANRVGTGRMFRIAFDLARPVEAPAAPWGWQD
ncbi:MAG: hypothetical protein M3485_08635 [Pseudomonadota bacterium]|nr:hypothetical protein [Pseudomonadota bacterium]